MQRSNLMPFFWGKLAAPALLLGAVASGCSAGSVEGRSGGEATTPSSNIPSVPSTSNTPLSTNPISATPPDDSGATGSASAASSTPTDTAAQTDDGDEALPNPNLDEGVEVANPDNPPGANPSDDEDDDDDGGDDNDDDDDGGDDDDENEDDEDDDDDDDDDGGDDDEDDDDGGDDEDDDDDVGVTPPVPNPGNPPPADAVTFSADIRPILVANCGRCHASGGLPQFASANAATGFDVAFRERNSIVSELRNGNMPADTCNGDPGSAGCVSVAEFDLIQQWVAAGAPE